MDIQEYTDMKAEFWTLYEDTRDKVISMIRNVLDGNDWTTSQLEAFWDKQIYNPEGISDEEYDEYSINPDMISLNDALDGDKQDAYIECDNKFETLSSVISVAKSMGIRLNGHIEVPYYVIILNEGEPLKDIERSMDFSHLLDGSELNGVHCEQISDIKVYPNREKMRGNIPWCDLPKTAVIISDGDNSWNIEEFSVRKWFETTRNIPSYTDDYDKYANNIIRNVLERETPFAWVHDNGKFVVTAHKDPSISNVCELWLKAGCDENGNGGQIFAKVYDLQGADEIARALRNIDEGKHIVICDKGRLPAGAAYSEHMKERADKKIEQGVKDIYKKIKNTTHTERE